MQDLDDNVLLRDYVERGSEEAFAALVTRHVNKVYSVALRHTGNSHQAEEITQAVFVILARKSHGLGKGVILSGWIYHTARLASLTFIRGEIRRARRQQEAHMQTMANESEADAWPQIAPLLDAAMANLNEQDRHAVVLRFIDQKSLREVGNAMGATEDAAKKRVTRALEKLRKYFSKRGVNSTTAIIAGSISANSVQTAPAGLAKLAIAAALAKNAAIGSSTLTLIKGALKIMAWTKAKTAIIVSVGVLLATGTTVVVERAVVAHTRTANDPSWEDDPHNWAINSQVLDTLPPAFILRTTRFPNEGGGVSSKGRYLWKNEVVQTLVGTAYDFPGTRIIFPPEMPPGQFDLLITVADHPKERLRDEIKKRFGLVAHVENREADVFRLRVSNPNPPNLKRHEGNNNFSSWIGRNTTTTIQNQSFNGFAGSIESNVRKPVIDETGLKDRYDLVFDSKTKPGESKDAAYRRALSEQLGLELVPDRAFIDELVVEKAQ
jgi:uncharacterized protein (TIGR03435 family)